MKIGLNFSSLTEGGGKLNNQFKGGPQRSISHYGVKQYPNGSSIEKVSTESRLDVLYAHLSTRISLQ